MDLILDKLGRIEHAEIEIRPLTVFVGENNTNKTWAAYCLYGLARHLTFGVARLISPTAANASLALPGGRHVSETFCGPSWHGISS